MRTEKFEASCALWQAICEDRDEMHTAVERKQEQLRRVFV